jgi:hypothetical protein
MTSRTLLGLLATAVALAPLNVTAQPQSLVHIETSSAIDYARLIARHQGYDVSNTRLYTFDQLDFKIAEYIAIDFRIEIHPGNLILISQSTGQAIDFNGCEIFAYPDLMPFQNQIMGITKVKPKTPGELANDVGCDHPKVLTKPMPLVTKKQVT